MECVDERDISVTSENSVSTATGWFRGADTALSLVIFCCRPVYLERVLMNFDFPYLQLVSHHQDGSQKLALGHVNGHILITLRYGPNPKSSRCPTPYSSAKQIACVDSGWMVRLVDRG
jgi:hypothetical protein